MDPSPFKIAHVLAAGPLAASTGRRQSDCRWLRGAEAVECRHICTNSGLWATCAAGWSQRSPPTTIARVRNIPRYEHGLPSACTSLALVPISALSEITHATAPISGIQRSKQPGPMIRRTPSLAGGVHSPDGRAGSHASFSEDPFSR